MFCVLFDALNQNFRWYFNTGTFSKDYSYSFEKLNNQEEFSKRTFQDLKMDTEKYVKETRFNQWAVHFSNKNAVPVDEVEKIFSQYGTIKNVSQTGDATGLCFVNFSSLQEAMKCIEGLHGHPLIHLREQKFLKTRESNKRNRDQNDNNDSNGNDNAIDYDSINSTKKDQKEDWFSDSKQEPLLSNKANTLDKEETINNVNHKQSVVEETPLTTHYNECSEGKIKQTICSDNHTSSCRNNFNKEVKEKTENVENTKEYENVIDLKNEGTNSSTSSCPISKDLKVQNCNNKVDPEMPTLMSRRRKDISMGAVLNGGRRPTKIMEAQEVIVANIHQDYGTNYVLHLLEKYQPLGASMINVLKPFSLRYCHVYFSTVEHADAVVAKFDKFELGAKKNLIALRVNTRGIVV